MDEFDYIVIGAGSAGCVLANRLSKDPGCRVALLEAGGRDSNLWIHIPVGYFSTMHNPELDWCFKTENDKGLNGRSLDWPRGKVLGGSSSINGLLYVRGQPEDYDRWRQLGNTGWGWDDILPLFKRAESFSGGSDDHHGGDGPLSVSPGSYERPICNDWIKAAQAAGYNYNSDYNGAMQEGVGHFQTTTRNGRRCSAAVAYLNPVRSRSNLEVYTNAHVTRIQITDRRATGVSFIDSSGSEQQLATAREIILSAGAIGSPHLLMVSGIGDAEHLSEHGIDVILDMPEVGKNLQDHLQARPVYKCHMPTLNNEVNSLLSKAMMALEYGLYRKGPMSMPASVVVGFMRTAEHVATPDIQFHVQPWSAESVGKGVHRFAAFTTSICQLRPESRGTIRLKSPDSRDAPAIHPNYLATETDRRTMIEGVKIARRIAAMEPLVSKISGEYRPGDDVVSDDEILEWVRNTSTTIFHPTGTCRMGQDTGAVVDEKLRLRGLKGLRIADCSIMPEIVSGNTNAAAIMIGEKASDIIADDNRV